MEAFAVDNHDLDIRLNMNEALYTMMLITGNIGGSPGIILQSATPKAPMTMPMEPEISSGLRPHFSTVKTASRVNRMLMIPMMTVCTIGLPMPIVSKMRGAK